MPIEDPFDATDNCARSIFKVNVGYVRDAFQESLAVLQNLPNSNGEPLVSSHRMTPLSRLLAGSTEKHYESTSPWQL